MLFIDSSDSHWSTTFYNKRPRRHGGHDEYYWGGVSFPNLDLHRI